MKPITANSLSKNYIFNISRISKKLSLIICVTIFAIDSHSTAQAALTATDLSTTNGNWKVTTDGLVNANPYSVNNSQTGFNYLIGLTDTGFSTGTFLPGGNSATFDGFWTASETFNLPAGSTSISLSYSGLFADDRVVLELNGQVINSTAIINSPGSQCMTLTDGGALMPWTFNGPDGFVGGTITSGFIVGGVNTLTAIINNTGNGGEGPDANLGTGDQSTFGLLGTLNYTVPEPAPIVILGTAGILVGLGVLCRQSNGQRRNAE